MDKRGKRQRIKSLGCAVALSLAAISCSGDSQAQPSSDTLKGWSDTAPTSAPITTAAPATTQAADVAASAPEALSLTDEDDSSEQPVVEGYARTTADGIVITGGPTMFDFGNGEVEAFEGLGETAGGRAGVVIPRESAWPVDEGEVDDVGWALSGNVFTVILETSDAVASVRLHNGNGSVDEATPFEARAIASIQASSLGQITIEALDASGDIIGTCDSDDTFINCQ